MDVEGGFHVDRDLKNKAGVLIPTGKALRVLNLKP